MDKSPTSPNGACKRLGLDASDLGTTLIVTVTVHIREKGGYFTNIWFRTDDQAWNRLAQEKFINIGFQPDKGALISEFLQSPSMYEPIDPRVAAAIEQILSDISRIEFENRDF